MSENTAPVPTTDRRRFAADGTRRPEVEVLVADDGTPAVMSEGEAVLTPAQVRVLGRGGRLEMGERIAAILAGGPVPTDEAGKRAVADEVTAEIVKMAGQRRHQSTREMQRRLRQQRAVRP